MGGGALESDQDVHPVVLRVLTVLSQIDAITWKYVLSRLALLRRMQGRLVVARVCALCDQLVTSDNISYKGKLVRNDAAEWIDNEVAAYRLFGRALRTGETEVAASCLEQAPRDKRYLWYLCFSKLYGRRFRLDAAEHDILKQILIYAVNEYTQKRTAELDQVAATIHVLM